MTSNKSDSSTDLELPAEIIVQTELVEAMMAKGQLKLTSDQIDQLEGSSTIRLPMELWDAVSQPQIRKTPIEWIEPLDAVHVLASKVGGDVAAKLAIAERLRDGAIKCSLVWMSEGPDIGPIGNKRPNFPVTNDGFHTAPWVSAIHRGKGPVILGGMFWSYSDDWEADLKRWNWREGIFVTSCFRSATVVIDGVPVREFNSKTRSRMIVSGIRFNKSDVARISGAIGLEDNDHALVQRSELTTKSSKARNRGATGPRPKIPNFALIVARLEVEIESGEISHLGKVTDYGVQAKLERKIIELHSEAYGFSPKEATVRRRAVNLMNIWRAQEGVQLAR